MYMTFFLQHNNMRRARGCPRGGVTTLDTYEINDASHSHATRAHVFEAAIEVSKSPGASCGWMNHAALLLPTSRRAHGAF